MFNNRTQKQKFVYPIILPINVTNNFKALPSQHFAKINQINQINNKFIQQEKSKQIEKNIKNIVVNMKNDTSLLMHSNDTQIYYIYFPSIIMIFGLSFGLFSYCKRKSVN